MKSIKLIEYTATNDKETNKLLITASFSVNMDGKESTETKDFLLPYAMKHKDGVTAIIVWDQTYIPRNIEEFLKTYER